MTLRIVLLGNAMSTMVRFRGPLIRALVEAGHEVIAVCPTGNRSDADALGKLEARHVTLNSMSRQGLNPLAELKLLHELTDVLRDIAPDRIFAYFLKPVIWGGIAAKRVGFPRCVGMIEGMGHTFSAPPPKPSQRVRQYIARVAILRLLKLACKRMEHVVVLNHDDAELLQKFNLVSAERLTVLDGIGVDLGHFAPHPPHLDPVRFVLAARLIREKGIEMFAAAAAAVKERYPEVRFRLLGGVDTAPGALPAGQIEGWVREGLIEWPGQVEDVRPHLRDSSVFVLPTLYSEGLPRSTMEAMAMGRPVITSDMPGAKSSVTHDISGLIVPAGNTDALINACLKFCDAPERITHMGAAALKEAQRRFDLNTQNQHQINLILGPDLKHQEAG